MNYRFGYNTNGFSNHSLSDIIDVVSGLGYEGLALSLDHAHCNPYQTNPEMLRDLRVSLSDRGLGVVIETGARYLLDKRQKHEPTLISSSGREKRVGFLKRAIDIAAALHAESVTFFSGVRKPNVSLRDAHRFFLSGCEKVLNYAAEKNMAMGLEPEPGMLVDTMEKFAYYDKLLDHPALNLTLDVGHLFCTEAKGAEVAAIERFGSKIISMHIEDIKDHTHHHLPFGEGDIDFLPVMKAIARINFQGLINVELSRDSHQAPDMAKNSIRFLKSLVEKISP
ncbi:MAG: hypothetical protein B6244_09695 [Candidatus Cloacimonetes bacterium 4572_55]|nr:MAG: hypothetical protein B6244_09695 [Candidatus Cloacimonetes bacterium 4572_55]